MTQPLDRYEIRLYDSSQAFVDILTGWTRLEYWQRINAPWNHTLTYILSVNDERLDLLRDIGPDYIYTIYRTDPNTFAKTLVYEGFHQTRVDQALADGVIMVTLYGQGYTSLLNRRVCIPITSEDQDERSGVAETVMKQFVTFNIFVPTDPDRAAPNFSVEPDLGRGNNVEYSARYTNLMTVIENLSEDGNLCFGVVGAYNADGTPLLFQFQTREIWGDDRRINSTNPAKETPCFFNYENKNMDIPILTYNFSEEKNLVYVAGQGTGNQRIFLELENLTATALSPFARKEAYIDSRGANTQNEILTVGRSYLEKNMAKNTLTFNLRQQESIQWLRDFNLGDIVTAKYFDHLQSKIVREVHATVATGEETVFPERIEIELDDLTEAQIDYLAEWTIDYNDPYPFTPDFFWPDLEAGLNNLAGFNQDGYLYRTANFQSTPPTWTRINLGLTGTIINFVVDAFSPGYLGTGTDINGWIQTNQKIYRITDIFGLATCVEQYSYGYTINNPGKYWWNAMGIDASFGTQNHVVALISQRGDAYGPFKAVYTTNGVTWNAVNLPGGTSASMSIGSCAVYVSPLTAGLVYATDLDTNGLTAHNYVSTDYGASWSKVLVHGPHSPLMSRLRYRGSNALCVPYNDNLDEADVYYARHNTGGNCDSGNLYRVRSGVETNITPNYGGSSAWVTRENRWGLVSAPTNRNYIAGVFMKVFGPATLFTSPDEGDNWTFRTSGSCRRVAISGNDPETLYIWGAAGYIFYSVDFGTTLINKVGNIGGMTSPTPGEFIGICGGIS